MPLLNFPGTALPPQPPSHSPARVREGARPRHRQAAGPQGREGAARQRWGGGRGVSPPGTRTRRESRARPCPAAPAAHPLPPRYLLLLQSVPRASPGMLRAAAPPRPSATAAFLFRRGWSRSRPAPGGRTDPARPSGSVERGGAWPAPSAAPRPRKWTAYLAPQPFLRP